MKKETYNKLIKLMEEYLNDFEGCDYKTIKIEELAISNFLKWLYTNDLLEDE